MCHQLFVLLEPSSSVEPHTQRAGTGRSRAIAHPQPFAPVRAHVRGCSFLHLLFFMARRDLTASGFFLQEEQPQAPVQAGAELLESSSAERDWECWGTTG